MKVKGALEALSGGAKEIFWGDGRVEHPITNLFQSQGTIIGD